MTPTSGNGQSIHSSMRLPSPLSVGIAWCPICHSDGGSHTFDCPKFQLGTMSAPTVQNRSIALLVLQLARPLHFAAHWHPGPPLPLSGPALLWVTTASSSTSTRANVHMETTVGISISAQTAFSRVIQLVYAQPECQGPATNSSDMLFLHTLFD